MNLEIFKDVGVVILAAGKGKRMQSDKLKVMHELKGRPLIDYVVKAVEGLILPLKPVVVVCSDDPAAQNFLGPRADYAIQTERLGTGHAVMAAGDLLKGKARHLVVLYGDMPFVKTESIAKLIAKHLGRGNKLTLMTATVEDFNDWRSGLTDYGRIIRGGEEKHIFRIVEKKDATPKELEIKELNPAIFCFDAAWLWEKLPLLKNSNAQSEYYLTDLVELAFQEGKKLSSVPVDPREAVGINTKEHLETAQNL